MSSPDGVVAVRRAGTHAVAHVHLASMEPSVANVVADPARNLVIGDNPPSWPGDFMFFGQAVTKLVIHARA